MTSVGVGVGRGRGWGKNTQDAGLRRPGQSPSGPKDEIVELIYNLNINDKLCNDDSSSSLINLLTCQGELTDDSIKNIETIYQEALNDRDFANRIFSILKQIKFRSSLFLTHLQLSFEKRDDLYSQSVVKFSNFTYFLSQFFDKFINSSTVSKIMASPVITCLEMSLNTLNEDDIELVLSQLLITGQKLYSLQPAELSNLIIQARRILIVKNLSLKSRAMLSLMIDLDNQKYHLLSVELKMFYIEQLGHDYWNNTPTNTSSPHTKINDTVNKTDAQPVHQKNANSGVDKRLTSPGNNGQASQVSHQQKQHDKTSPKSSVNNSGRPRAIRGSGANDYKDKDFRNDKKPMGKKDKNSDAQWSNWNDGKKAWGHDDRFDKDY